MKKIVFLLLPVILFSMCTNKKAIEEAQLRSDSLQRVSLQKDSAIYAFMGTFNEIESNLQEIKAKENIITLNAGEMGSPKKREDQINEDINFIYDLMLQNKERVADLEKQLKRANIKSAELQKTIANLQSKLQEKDVQILNLREELKNMNIKVDELNYKIDTLKFDNEVKEAIIQAQDESLNTAYFLFGSMKELKESKVIDKKGGFIGTKKINRDFDKELFTKIDIREKTEFQINSQKIKIMSTHPSSSFKIVGEKPVEKIEIIDPDEFWSVSKYLIIALQ